MLLLMTYLINTKTLGILWNRHIVLPFQVTNNYFIFQKSTLIIKKIFLWNFGNKYSQLLLLLFLQNMVGDIMFHQIIG
jgi:hypothetical protein